MESTLGLFPVSYSNNVKRVHVQISPLQRRDCFSLYAQTGIKILSLITLAIKQIIPSYGTFDLACDPPGNFLK